MGNDFAVFVDLEDSFAPEIKEVRAVCDRHFGLGADGLIRITLKLDPAEDTSYFFMDYYNQDGSIAKMCGNGVRVVAHIIELSGLHDFNASPELEILTRAGVKTVEKVTSPDGDQLYRVDMGRFTIDADTKHVVSGASSKSDDRVGNLVGEGLYVNMGNDHVVVECTELFDTLSDENDTSRGDVLDLSTDIDANIELIKVDAKNRSIDMRVVERGVGETLSCGTGICAASVYASHIYGGDDWGVQVPGGNASTLIDGGRISLEGPAKLVGKFYMVEDYLDDDSIKEILNGGEDVN
jgi:diaminopimelate epimerase